MYAPGVAVTLQVVSDDRDLDRLLAIRNAIEARPLTVDGWHAENTATIGHLELLATDAGDLGAGDVGWGTASAEHGIAFIGAWVLPESRGRGIGRLLVDRLMSFARDGGMTSLRAAVREDDEESLAFATRRGFEVSGRGSEGALDLTSVQTSPPDIPPGIEITTLAERPDLVRDVYDLIMRVRPEIPSARDEPEPSFEAWRADTVEDPGFLTAMTLLALDGGRVVGTIAIYDNSSGVIYIGMTAVDPAYRRQGIARLLKAELSHRSKAAGIVRIETYNDGTNERIRTLNESLGYVYLPWKLLLRGAIPEPADARSR